MRRQLGKPDLLAVRSDKEERVAVHQDIPLWQQLQTPRIAKEGCRCIKVRAARLSRVTVLNQMVRSRILRIETQIEDCVRELLSRALAFRWPPDASVYAQTDPHLLEVIARRAREFDRG